MPTGLTWRWPNCSLVLMVWQSGLSRAGLLIEAPQEWVVTMQHYPRLEASPCEVAPVARCLEVPQLVVRLVPIKMIDDQAPSSLPTPLNISLTPEALMNAVPYRREQHFAMLIQMPRFGCRWMAHASASHISVRC